MGCHVAYLGYGLEHHVNLGLVYHHHSKSIHGAFLSHGWKGENWSVACTCSVHLMSVIWKWLQSMSVITTVSHHSVWIKRTCPHSYNPGGKLVPIRDKNDKLSQYIVL